MTGNFFHTQIVFHTQVLHLFLCINAIFCNKDLSHVSLLISFIILRIYPVSHHSTIQLILIQKVIQLTIYS